MARYLLKLSYIGTNFCGWQVQPNGNTVQAELCNALKIILGKDVGVTGCSRTDSGVHANAFCCHFDFETNIPPKNLIEAINHNTSDDISVFDCIIVDDNFHTRYSCKAKNYIYRICNTKQPNPFENGRSLWYKYQLDIEKMNEAAKFFVGEYDFSAFCSSGSSVDSKIRNVTDCSVSKVGDIITVSITANGFLYNMVRIIVGTLLEVGQGKREINSIINAINSQKRENAGITAAPDGLYLNEVYY